MNFFFLNIRILKKKIVVLINVIIKNLNLDNLYFLTILYLFLTSYIPNLKLLLSIDRG